MATSRFLDLVREVGRKVACLEEGVSTDAATTSLTVGNYHYKTSRTNESNRTLEGDELYLTNAEGSSTLSSAITAAATSIAVASGSSFAATSGTPYVIGIDSELILVTLSSNTFTAVSNGRGWGGTRPAAHASGATVRGPSNAPNPEQIAAYVASTGVFTPGNAWVADPGGAGISFCIFTRGVSIWDVRRAINEALREIRDDSWIPFSKITDGDMRNDGTADWTASGSPTVSKVTNSNAIWGPQSLRVLATVANDYVQSNTIVADPTYSKVRTVVARLRADVGTATLRAYDVTNSAEIKTETWSNRGWGFLVFPFTLPATCEAYAYQLESDTSTSDVYWNFIDEIAPSAVEVDLPSWVTRSGEVKGVFEDWSNNRSDQPVWVEIPGFLIHDPSNPNNQFKYHLQRSPARPLVVHVSRPHDGLTGDAQTTFADRDLVVAAAAVKLCDMMVARNIAGAALHWQRQRKDRLEEYAELTWNLLPAPELKLGYSRTW